MPIIFLFKKKLERIVEVNCLTRVFVKKGRPMADGIMFYELSGGKSACAVFLYMDTMPLQCEPFQMRNRP